MGQIVAVWPGPDVPAKVFLIQVSNSCKEESLVLALLFLPMQPRRGSSCHRYPSTAEWLLSIT